MRLSVHEHKKCETMRVEQVGAFFSQDRIDRYLFCTIVDEALRTKATVLSGITELLGSVRKLHLDRVGSEYPPGVAEDFLRFGDSRVDVLAATTKLLTTTQAGPLSGAEGEKLAGEMLTHLLLYFREVEIDPGKVIADYCYNRMFGVPRPVDNSGM